VILSGLPTFVEVALVVGALATASLAVSALVARSARAAKVASHALAALIGARVEEIVDRKVAPILAEVKPNSGASLKDQATRIEYRLVDLADEGAAGRQAIRADFESHVDSSGAQRADIRGDLEAHEVHSSAERADIRGDLTAHIKAATARHDELRAAFIDHRDDNNEGTV